MCCWHEITMNELLKGPSNERDRKDFVVAISDAIETSFSKKNSLGANHGDASWEDSISFSFSHS